MASVDPKTGKPVVSSAGKFFGMNTIYGRDGEHGTPYMTRVWFWGLRLHIFHRPDLDEDCHDHPWDFTTIPLWPPHGYVEEVVTYRDHWVPDMPVLVGYDEEGFAEYIEHHTVGGGQTLKVPVKVLQIVPAYRPSYRPATHCHRVLGAYRGYDEANLLDLHWTPGIDPNRKVVTLVWRGKANRDWGFLKNRDGKWCWVAWRDYVFAGGKDGPCQ